MQAEPDRETVREQVEHAFPNNHKDVMENMQWSSIDGNWVYTLHGIMFGVETDGYIHS